MNGIRTCLTALASVAVVVGVPTAVGAQSPFTGNATGLRITLPEGWKAQEQGGAVRITAPDGSAYTLKRDDTAGKAAGADPTRSSALRDAAEAMAQSVVEGPRYAGVKPLTVTGGSGAVFRFRGQGKRSGDDLVEVWVAVIGGKAAVLAPVAAPQADHAYELGVIGKSLSLGDPGKPTRSAETSKTAEAVSQQDTTTRSATQSKPHAPATETATTTSTQPSVELETYEGHVVAGDVGFKLHIFEGTRAAAEWDRSVGQEIRYAGTYTGSDGNYAIKLSASKNASEQAPLSMTLRSLGGMVHATYAEGSALAQRDVADLKLTGVYTPSAKLKGTGGGSRNANRGRNANQRGRTNGRTGNRGNTRGRGRRIIIPGIGNPIRP